jgi:hypothetical protein
MSKIVRDKFGKFITLAKIKKIENETTREIGRRVVIALTLLCVILWLLFSFV